MSFQVDNVCCCAPFCSIECLHLFIWLAEDWKLLTCLLRLKRTRMFCGAQLRGKLRSNYLDEPKSSWNGVWRFLDSPFASWRIGDSNAISDVVVNQLNILMSMKRVLMTGNTSAVSALLNSVFVTTRSIYTFVHRSLSSREWKNELTRMCFMAHASLGLSATCK